MENARILVVDDSEITLFKIKAILLRLGYVVTTHTNPLNALEWIKAPGSGVPFKGGLHIFSQKNPEARQLSDKLQGFFITAFLAVCAG